MLTNLIRLQKQSYLDGHLIQGHKTSDSSAVSCVVEPAYEAPQEFDGSRQDLAHPVVQLFYREFWGLYFEFWSFMLEKVPS